MNKNVQKFLKKYSHLYSKKTLSQINIKENQKIITCELCKEKHPISQIPFLHTVIYRDGIIEIFDNKSPSGKYHKFPYTEDFAQHKQLTKEMLGAST